MLFLWQPAFVSIFSQIDLMARGGSIALLALWSWLLIRDHRGQFAGKLAVVMALAIICYLIVTAELYPRLTLSGLVLALCGSSTPGIFWLFAKAWFNDAKHIRHRDLALVLLAAANTLVMLMTNPDGGIVNLTAGTLFRISMLSFAAAGLWEAWRGREGDLIESRRRLRPRLVAAVGTYVVMIALSEIAVHNLGMPYWLIGIVTSSIVFITFLFCAAMFGMRQSDLFGPVNGTKPSTSKPVTDDLLAEKLRSHMERELAWRNEGLSIAGLAAQLGEQEYRLRRVINGQLGHRNFAAFLNGYRLAEVKGALSDPTQTDVPIITIALDAGFGSLGPFNRAFREAEGITPSAFRAQTTG
jgi:AraC-like DNA-binding protein